MTVWVINGPNLNMLGIREPQIYGRTTYEGLCGLIRAHAEKLGVEVFLYQSNHEGDLVDTIQQALGKADIALLDALKAVGIPAVEVHISDPDTREDFRRVSYIRTACVKTIKGHGLDGYLEAMDFLAGGKA